MFPIAYAVVESETLESWEWFIELLIVNFDVEDGEGWTFICDRDNGLFAVVEDMLPMAEHRLCVRHLHNEMKKPTMVGQSRINFGLVVELLM